VSSPSLCFINKTPRFIAPCPKPPKCLPKKNKEMQKFHRRKLTQTQGPNPQLHLSLEKEAGKEKIPSDSTSPLELPSQRLYRGKEQRRHEQAESRPALWSPETIARSRQRAAEHEQRG